MGSLNKIMLIGRVGSDPEIRGTQSGKKVASFSLATSERYKDRNGEWQNSTEWHKVSCWGKLAEIVGEYCKKGKEVYVEGSIKTNSYQDKNGNKKESKEVNAAIVNFLGSKENSGNQKRNYDNNKSRVNQNSIDDDFLEDDIPF